MDSELDFDPSQYTRLPPYLDNAMTLALARQILAASATLTAPHLKRSHQDLAKASQRLADALVDSLGQDAPADKRPIDQLADHSWSAIHHRLLGWLELPPSGHPEVAQAQALFDKLFPTGLRFIQLEYGAQWIEADARICWLKQAGQLADLEKLCGKAFVTELLQTHTAYGQMVGADPKQRQKTAKKPDLTTLRKQLQLSILAHQLQLVALRVSADETDRLAAEAALRPVDEYRVKLAPNRGPKSAEPGPGDPNPLSPPETPAQDPTTQP